jgi:acyl carrier protein
VISHTEEGGRRGSAVDLVETLAALRSVPGVRDAFVTERAGRDGLIITVGYVMGPDPAPGTAWIRQDLLGRLPGYLIPEQLFVIDELPLTPEGDYDLKALPDPYEESSQADSYVAPRTPVEQQIADIVKELLSIEQVGIHDSFFGLGGSSFLATRLTGRIREIFDVELLLRDVFASPTVDGLAQMTVGILARSEAEQRRARRRRLRERAFRYVAGHPALVTAWRKVWRPGPDPARPR